MAKGKSAKQTQPNRPAATKADWQRDQFSARFTANRRDGLRQIAADMPPGATPIEAVDRAVELALAAKRIRQDVPASLGALEGRLDRFEAIHAEETREAREAARETLRQVREIAGLMSAVAAAAPDDEGADMNEERDHGAAAMSLRAWLDARGSAVRSVGALARWRSKSRLTDRHVAMEFEIGVAGSASARSVVRLEPLDTASPFARADAIAALSFDCRRDPRGGWLVSARPINADRSAGPLIDEIKV